MKCCIITISFLISYSVLTAQLSRLDSLKYEYKSATSLNDKKDVLKQISALYNGAELNDDSLKYYSKKGWKLLEDNNVEDDLPVFYIYYAAAHFYKDTSVYFDYLQKAEQLAVANDDEFTALTAALYQIIRHQNFANTSKVRTITQRCFPLIEQMKQRGETKNKGDVIVSRIYAKAAANALTMGDTHESLRLTYLLQDYSYAKNNLIGKIETYDSFINAYKQILKNVSFGSQSLDKRDIDTLLHQSIDSMYNLSKTSDSRFVISRHGVAQINKANYYYSRGNIDTALVYYKEADAFATAYTHNLIGLQAQQGLFDICMEDHRSLYDCQKYLVKMDSILTKTNTDSWAASALERKLKYYQTIGQLANADLAYNQLKIIVNKYPANPDYIDAYKTLVEYADKRNNTGDALRYFKEKTAIRDSLSAEVLTYDIENLRIKYNVANVQAENAKLREDKALQRLKSDRLLYGILILLILGTMLGLMFSYRNRNRILQSQRKNEEFKQKLLRAQLSPHFTFNVLGTIQGYIYQGKLEEAEKAIGEFANLIRKSLEYTNLKDITIQEEIDFIDAYLNLERGRKDGLFDYEIVVDDFNLFRKIQPLFVQPLVENSIKHGFRDMDNGGIIKVQLSKLRKGLLSVKVSDNGSGYRQTKLSNHKSLGLSLIEERMNILNKTTPGYTIEVSTSTSGTMTTLTLPYV